MIPGILICTCLQKELDCGGETLSTSSGDQWSALRLYKIEMRYDVRIDTICKYIVCTYQISGLLIRSRLQKGVDYCCMTPTCSNEQSSFIELYIRQMLDELSINMVVYI